VSEAAGPEVVAVGEGFVFPARSMSDDMVMAAEWVKVIDRRRSAL
jgi:hypothetical protein